MRLFLAWSCLRSALFLELLMIPNIVKQDSQELNNHENLLYQGKEYFLSTSYKLLKNQNVV